MRILLQILGTDTGDISPSCLIVFDQETYLFNCGEGTQRLCTQYKIRMSKITDIFFTSLNWESIGGFAGYSLTLADMLIGRSNAIKKVKINKEKNKQEFNNKQKNKSTKNNNNEKDDMEDEPNHNIDQVEKENDDMEDDRQNINVVGPKNTSNYISSLRYFVNRKDLVYNVREFHTNEDEPLKKKDLKVTPIVLFKENHEFSKSSNNNNNCINILPPEKESELSRGRVIYSNEQTHEISFNLAFIYPEKLVQQHKRKNLEGVKEPLKTQRPPEEPIERIVPSTKPEETMVCYLCQTSDVPGKFDANKAVQLGVPNGPLRSKLTKGESIQLPNSDVIIHPHQVVGPAQIGTIFLIVYCPSKDYVKSLVENKTLQEYYSGSEKPISIIVHMTPQPVIDTELYQQWIDKFGDNCKHLIVNKESCPQKPNFRSTAKANFKLNHINQSLFPLIQSLPQTIQTSPIFKKKNVFIGDNLMTYLLTPKQQWEKKELERSSFEKNLGKECVQQLTSLDLFNDSMNKFGEFSNKERVVWKELGLKTPFEELEIVFLGTGAALPSLHRNVSGCVVDFGETSFMMDCGEGSWGQMVRRYGIDLAEKILLRMKFIFISHNHADHHLGISRVLKQRERILGKEENEKNPMVIIGPTWINFFLTEHCEVEAIHFTFINAEEINIEKSENKNNIEVVKKLLTECGIEKMECVEVIHCPFAYGLAIQHEKSGFKLVYSGDTRPSEGLVKLGHEAHLLIHEATFEPTMENMAVIKRHSTTSEAMDIGMKMKARYTLLFHFSQRYPKLPSFLKEGSENDPYVENTGLAFDLMSIKIQNLPIISHVIPLIQFVFPPEEENEENI
eukprot:TRINITY_DN5116_c0_g1_i1.p1 TRINITY_DN5116_c0_g1~~TRINITY_DN5116_c0_g1_i1.p1  ORF type:complete len:844 (-),score=281.12 TRINITY_DN5116_c0_g1_i1:64-2595(-)